jgi:hypothetical protein
MSIKRWAATLVDHQPVDALRAMVRDPEAALRDHYDISVAPIDRPEVRGERGACDGVSIIDNNVILYKPTRSRRQSFTLAHEFGHYLIDSDEDCLNWCFDQRDPGRTIEMLADAIAALVLIPASDRDALSRPVAAQSVIELCDLHSASRSACLNVVVDLLPHEGFGVLVDLYEPETVFYAARKSETRPYPWRGDRVTPGSRLGRIQADSRGRAAWPYPDGVERQLYYDAVVDGQWLIALYSDANIWQVPGVSFVDADDRNRYDGDVTCKNQSCGYKGPTSYFPCNKCGYPTCPKCRLCRCDTDAHLVKTAVCAHCTATVRAELLDDDSLCSGCR